MIFIIKEYSSLFLCLMIQVRFLSMALQLSKRRSIINWKMADYLVKNNQATENEIEECPK